MQVLHSLVGAPYSDTLIKVGLSLAALKVGLHVLNYCLSPGLETVTTPRGIVRVPRTASTLRARALYKQVVDCRAPSLLGLAVGIDEAHTVATALLFDAVKRERERGLHHGVFYTPGVVMGQTLEHGPRLLAEQRAAMALDAMERARDDKGVVIIGESHGSSSAGDFRSCLAEEARHEHVVLLEGRCASDKFNSEQIVSSYAPGRPLGHVRGLEKASTLALHSLLTVISDLRQGRVEENAIRCTASIVSGDRSNRLFTKALLELRPEDRPHLKSFVSDLLARSFMTLAIPDGRQTCALLETYFVAVAKFTSTAGVSLIAVKAFESYVFERKNQALDTAYAALMLSRDENFAEAIYNAEKQFPGRRISAVVGFCHAARTRALLESLRTQP